MSIQNYDSDGLCIAIKRHQASNQIIGYFVFDEIPDLYTWIGALIIFAGVLIISYREMKLDKEIIRKRVDIKS